MMTSVKYYVANKIDITLDQICGEMQGNKFGLSPSCKAVTWKTA
jgi:hypothetical protein